MAFTDDEKTAIKALKGYRQIETALKYLIAKTPAVTHEYSETDDYTKQFEADKSVVQGHYRNILEYNVSVTLTPGSISRELFGERQLTVEWPINIEMFFVQNKDKLEDFYAHLEDVRDNFLDVMDLFPVMGGVVPGVINMFVGSADEPEWTQISRYYVWTQRFECQVRQQKSIALLGDWKC